MILTKLKEATREKHENLEKTVDIIGHTFSLDNYKVLLIKFYRFYAAIEPQIATSGLQESDINFSERSKIRLIEKDLESVGMEKNELGKVKPWEHAPSLDSRAKAFGSLYVLEGATLGGQIISRHLKEQLGIGPDTGGAFFNSYGPQVGPMWKAFGSAVTAFAEKADRDEEIVESARKTFDSFRLCFESPVDDIEDRLEVMNDNIVGQAV